MTDDPSRIPVVVATGQAVDRTSQSGPLELAEQAAVACLAEAGGLGSAVERVSVVNILSRRATAAPASVLADRLGLRPRVAETTVIGGNMPQALVNRAAADIAAGRLTATLILGAEAVRTSRMRGQAEQPAARAEEPTGHDPVLDDSLERVLAPGEPHRQDLSDEERAAGLIVPVLVYPLFESVLAARAGRTPAAQRAEIGRFLERFSAVAAGHPYAWFTDPLSAGEIAEPSAGNRLVAEPYTKRMVAFLGCAHGSALLVTSLAAAEAAGVADRAVFVAAGADATETWYPIHRPELGGSTALREAAAGLFAAAGRGVDDLTHLDLYSCFPSAVEVAAEAVGVALDDPRALTVTGGLPYFGGPGSNYVGHSIATTVEAVREAPGGLGLVTGVGWYLTKHSVGLYSAEPPVAPFRRVAARPAAEREAPVAVGAVARSGELAVVEAATVVYDREGAAVAAPAYCRLAEGGRVACAVHPDELAAVAAVGAGESLVGRPAVLEPPAAGAGAPTYRLS